MDTLSSPGYRFTEEMFGFRVEGERRPPVAVVFRPTGLEAWHVGDTSSIGPARERFGFFNFGKLLEFVARGLMRDWRPPLSPRGEGWHGARRWAVKQTARAIARRLREQWQRLVRRADPTVLAVQKAVFAATFGDAPLCAEPALYQDPFLVRDILQYPAAAIAVRNAWVLCRDLPLARLHHSPQAGALAELARQMGLQVKVEVTAWDDPDPATQLKGLQDWKSLFANTGHTYRSLNRTLMNLPGGVPHRLVCNLRFLRLERPVEKRLELLALVIYAGLRISRQEGVAGRADHTHLFQHARAAQVREALRRVGEHLRQPLSPRKAQDVRQMVQFLADYPEPHSGNLVGLAERALRWHRQWQQEQLARVLRLYGEQTPTLPPPVALPEKAGVRFLGTVGEVCAEGARMQHCVACYVEQAVQGNCYLFHVDYRGEEATVEVGCEGRVRQAQGPRNSRNVACRWGKKVLNLWASSFPVTALAQQPAGPADEEIPF